MSIFEKRVENSMADNKNSVGPLQGAQVDPVVYTTESPLTPAAYIAAFIGVLQAATMLGQPRYFIDYSYDGEQSGGSNDVPVPLSTNTDSIQDILVTDWVQGHLSITEMNSINAFMATDEVNSVILDSIIVATAAVKILNSDGVRPPGAMARSEVASQNRSGPLNHPVVEASELSSNIAPAIIVAAAVGARSVVEPGDETRLEYDFVVQLGDQLAVSAVANRALVALAMTALWPPIVALVTKMTFIVSAPPPDNDAPRQDG